MPFFLPSSMDIDESSMDVSLPRLSVPSFIDNIFHAMAKSDRFSS